MAYGKMSVNLDFSVIITVDIDLMIKIHGMDYLKYIKESVHEFGAQTCEFIDKQPLVQSCKLDITEVDK